MPAARLERETWHIAREAPAKAAQGRPWPAGPGRGLSGGNQTTALGVYEAELARLQAELVALQEWVRSTGARVLVLFEGRDAAGKGSAIKRVTEYLNPRVARIVALPAPPTGSAVNGTSSACGASARSGGNRADGPLLVQPRRRRTRDGVLHARRTQALYGPVPVFERLLIQDGILMFKYWFSISHAEQERRFRSRLEDPLRQWKLSLMDREAILRWEDYSRAKDDMFVQTDTAESPWFVVEAEDKRRARINMIAHLLSSIDYTEVRTEPVTLPERPRAVNYTRPPRELYRYVPDHARPAAEKPARNSPEARPAGGLSGRTDPGPRRHPRQPGTPQPFFLACFIALREYGRSTG